MPPEDTSTALLCPLGPRQSAPSRARTISVIHKDNFTATVLKKNLLYSASLNNIFSPRGGQRDHSDCLVPILFSPCSRGGHISVSIKQSHLVGRTHPPYTKAPSPFARLILNRTRCLLSLPVCLLSGTAHLHLPTHSPDDSYPNQDILKGILSVGKEWEENGHPL